MRVAVLVAFLLAAPGRALGAGGAEAVRPFVLAPGWEALRFAAPEPGSYELPPLGHAADGAVLDTTGAKRRLYDFLGDRIVLLSFIYTRCPDVNACPLATHVLQRVRRRVAGDQRLRDRVRLLTLSFDPQHDTPEVLRQLATHAGEGPEWRLLTTDSEESLAPILRAYGQSVRKDHDEQGRPLGTMSHILRVLLIDSERRIRNIYTASFLHADTVWSDIRTIAMERGDSGGLAPAAAAGGSALHGAGDDKRGYDRADYETHSKSLAARRGGEVELMGFFSRPPLGLPPVPVPADNPMSAAKVALGRKLFFDRRLSRNDTISCAMCHVPEQGFASNEVATAVGIEGQTVRRNAPTIYNAAFAEMLFHDGRESRLEQQIWGPLLASNEMGNPAVGYVLDTIRSLSDYRSLFEGAFDGRGPTMETVGMAIASYERALVSANSPFDRWRFAKEEGAISAAAQRGFALFRGKAGCEGCHRVEEDHALFTDQQLHNTGVGYRQTMGRPTSRRKVQVAPGVFVDVDPTVVAAAAERPPSDLGRYEITEIPEDRWKYKTPSLRNVELTAPYMHDGSLKTLREVVEFYDAGGVPNETLDPRITPLGLDGGEIEDLVAFLESLTGDNVDVLVADAFAAPVGDPR